MRTSRCLVGWFVVVVAVCASGAARAQSIVAPPNVLLPNNEGLPVGPVGGLEGNAFVARVDDTTAGWFNPAGLAAARGSSASVAAGSFRFTSVTDEAASSAGGSSVTQLPAAVGVVFRKHDSGLTWGFSVSRTAGWQQSTDAQFLTPGALRSYLTLAGDTEFNRATVAITVGGTSGGWRLGGGLLGDILNLRNVQALSFRQETGGPISTSVASYRATGAQGTLRLGLGLQKDLLPDWTFGVTARTPGVRILPSGTYAVDIVSTAGAVQSQTSFFDATPDFVYKVPFEVAAGIAWRRPEFELEVDVKGQTGVSAYDGFRSTQPVLSIRDAGTGAPPSLTTAPFGGVTFESRGIVNVALGGHVRLDSKGIWVLHAGFSTDRSPAGDADRFFSRANLNTVTVGLSGTAFHVSGSLGVTYQFGSSDAFGLPDGVGGTLARTKFKVSNFGVLYSISFF